MTPQEIAQMHIQSIGGSWDLYPAHDASIDDLDIGLVNDYIKKANSTKRRKIKDERPLHVLKKLELIREEGPTWAAILLFGKKPQRHLSQAKSHCGRFKSETKVIDERMMEGTVIEQIEDIMDFVKKNINVGLIMTENPARDEIWDYPLEALREAIINAICHRDYTITSNTEVKIYDDKLNIWSPGKLPIGVTIEDLYNPHSSTIRNKGIASVFYDIGLIEQWGSGIDKIVQSCEIAGNPKPEFNEGRGVSVTLRKDIYTEDHLKKIGLNDRQIKAVLHLKDADSINLSSYRELEPDTSKKTLYRDLKDLVDRDIIIPIGEKKGRVYKLK